MAFTNRAEAGRRLAERLGRYKGRRPVILAIPRGAVPMCRIIADALEGDLDVVLVHKLGAPGNPELAIGSVDDLGHRYVDPDLTYLWNDTYLEAETRAQVDRLRQRREAYSRLAPPIDLTGRIAIVVDDGIATGSTMIAALRAVRARGPAELVAATAVAPAETLRRLAREADEVVCVEVPEVLRAIGMHFVDFSQVSDEEVVEALAAGRHRMPDTGQQTAEGGGGR